MRAGALSEVLKEPGLVAGLGKGKFQEHKPEPKGENEHSGRVDRDGTCMSWQYLHDGQE